MEIRDRCNGGYFPYKNGLFFPCIYTWGDFLERLEPCVNSRNIEELRLMTHSFIEHGSRSDEEKEARIEFLGYAFCDDFAEETAEDVKRFFVEAFEQERELRNERRKQGNLEFLPLITTPDEFKWNAISMIKLGYSDELDEIAHAFISAGVTESERAQRKKMVSFVSESDFKNKNPEKQIVAIEWANIREHTHEDNRKSQDNRREQPKAHEILEANHIGKCMANTLSSCSFNYIKLKTKKDEGQIEFIKREVREESNEEREVIFEVKHLSNRVEILIDFLFDKFAKRNDALLIKNPPKETNAIIQDGFDMALERFTDNLPGFAPIKFTSKEFRSHFQIRITDKEITQAVDELMNTVIKLQGVRIWFDSQESEGNKRYKKITHTDRIINSTTIRETGKVAPRTKDAQHEFIVRFGSGWALLFYNDIVNRRYSCFPKEFYQISPGAIDLGRYLSNWQETYLTIEQASEILGYENNTANLTNRKYLIERKLDELKKIEFIRWKRLKRRGKETLWKINKF